MGKVMVTGANGNVGGYVVEYLIKNGQDVVGRKPQTFRQFVQKIYVCGSGK